MMKNKVTRGYKRKDEQYFNRRVKLRSFKEGDLVLKKMEMTTPREGKIGP